MTSQPGTVLSKVLLMFSSWTFRSVCSAEQYLDRGRFSQKLIIRFYLNSPDSKIVTRVTYCDSLDEFLCAKVEI